MSFTWLTPVKDIKAGLMAEKENNLLKKNNKNLYFLKNTLRIQII